MMTQNISHPSPQGVLRAPGLCLRLAALRFIARRTECQAVLQRLGRLRLLRRADYAFNANLTGALAAVHYHLGETNPPGRRPQ
jgi:hypothetical protein